MADTTDSAWLERLAHDMRLTTADLDAQPADRVWTQEEAAALEKVRRQARSLHAGALALIEQIEARGG